VVALPEMHQFPTQLIQHQRAYDNTQSSEFVPRRALLTRLRTHQHGFAVVGRLGPIVLFPCARGSPVAVWASRGRRSAYKMQKLSSFGRCFSGTRKRHL